MTNLKIILPFLLISLYSWGQDNHSKADVNVLRLSNKIIPLINFTANRDSCKKALLFLDSATAIDNNCFLCYYNKLIFLTSLKQYNQVFSTIDTCIMLRPNANDLYLTAGLLHESVEDTISSKPYFKKSLALCNAVLDTMSVDNRDYTMFATNEAINLIMLDDFIHGNKMLKHLYDIQINNAEKKHTLLLMEKTKKQLIDMYFKK